MLYEVGTFEKIAEGFEKQALKFPSFLKNVNASQKWKALHGYANAAREGGPESFLATLPIMVAEKIFGKRKIRSKMWNYVFGPALAADTHAGKVLSKTPLIGGLFKQKEQIPWGKDLHKTVERTSALAPLVKARNIAVPIIAGIGLEKGVKSISQHFSNNSSNKSQEGDMMGISDTKKIASEILEPELREKVASTMLRLHATNKEHEKRAQATKLLYKQAEMGYAPIPNTYREYEQKLASLISQDMAVLEKALELTAGNEKMGELTGNDSNSYDAAATFQAEVLSF